MTTSENTTNDRWAELLKAAVEQPGMVLAAYSNFHNYSLGNQIAAMFQCSARDIKPGPISTYANWQKLGRQVRKGEKALELCQPVTCKRRNPKEDENETFTLFTWKKSWFVLAQTDGEAIEPEPIPEWNRTAALEALSISEVPFEHTNGNVQGYARLREIAISPVAAMPHKTTFHELAHIVLGHTTEGEVSDSELTPRDLREVEAESVALLCCESLNLEGAEYCRGYIQNWLEGDSIPERSAQRIFKAADRILKAGQVTDPPSPPPGPAESPVEERSMSGLEQELAALEIRTQYLRLRMESSASYSSPRFRGLSAQTYRHKLARVQKRTIEIQVQLGQREGV